jgi:PIN domain nuclease of toxin-antitoxin system
MKRYVTDTHPLHLHLIDQHKKMGKQARRIYNRAVHNKAIIVIPTICLVEIMELTEVGKLKLKDSFRAVVKKLPESFPIYELMLRR